MRTPDRNIVLITADSLRADHCGFLNRDVQTTAILDQMADDGIVFENAITPGPRTPSAMPEIFTGEDMPITHADTWDWKVRTARIGNHLSTHETLAQKLSDLGYTTAAFTANPWTTRTTNFDSGFDHFQEIKHESTRELVDRFSGTAFKPIIWASRWIHKDSWFSQWPTFYDDVRQATDELEEPYFLWIFLMDTHTPFVVPRQDRTESSTLGMYYGLLRSSSIFGEQEGQSYYRKKLPAGVESRIKQAYRDAIRSVDRFVGTLRDDLRDDDPVFVFHSDHGEAFNEHGTYGHQQTLYEENIRVPLLISNCGQSAEIEAPISLRSLPDLLTSYASDKRFEPSEWTAEYTVSRTEDSETMAVRENRWKYIASDTTEELYDLSTDPRERRDLLDREPERAAELHAILTDYKQFLPTDRGEYARSSSPDTEMRDRLESLGYLE